MINLLLKNVIYFFIVIAVAAVFYVSFIPQVFSSETTLSGICEGKTETECLAAIEAARLVCIKDARESVCDNITEQSIADLNSLNLAPNQRVGDEFVSGTPGSDDFVSGTPGVNSDAFANITWTNPLAARGFTSIEALVTGLLNAIIVIAIPIIVLMIIYGGFLYVTARGNPEQIRTANNALTFAIIGGVLIIISVAITTIIGTTVGEFRS